MFFLCAILAAFGYSLQGALMAGIYRRHDTFSAVAYRGLALGFAMLPLLLLAQPPTIVQLRQAFPSILAASVLCALGNWGAANACVFLPVSLATAALMSVVAVSGLALGYLFLGEKLILAQLGFVILILAAVMLLGMSQGRGKLPQRHDPKRGLLNALWGGVILSGGYTMIGIAARQLDPFIAGYSWEFSIGLIALAAATLRGRLGGPPFTVISRRDFRELFWACSPTLIGTGLYALSMTLGPIGVATAIISVQMIFSTILGYLFYGEKLSLKQWALLIAACLMVAGLKLSTP